MPLDSGDLEDIANWLAEAPSCLREAWEGLGQEALTARSVDGYLARHWLILDNMHGYYEDMAEQWRAEERQDRIDEARSLDMERSAWRNQRGCR